MSKCVKCQKGLSGAVKSAVKKDGSFYLACVGCGNVMYVTVNSLGLTEVSATLEGTSKEAVKQMIEAKELFEAVGHKITTYIDTMNGEKKSAAALRKVDYDAVKAAVKESVKDIVASVAKSVDVPGAKLSVYSLNKVTNTIVDAIKDADRTI